ncbi:MAG: PHP domain-containing protein [Acidobacteriota bacterium]
MKPEPAADLHAHSSHSDGLLAPAEVVRQAAATGLHALALTDHDGTAGIDEAVSAGGTLGLKIIPGVEISCRHLNTDIHLLGWFIDPSHAGLRKRLAGLVQARENRLARMLEALGQGGAVIEEAAVRRAAGPLVIGRPHIARALVEAGHARSVQDAFDRWLKQGQAGFVPLQRIPAAEAVATVKAAGGVAGIAHAGLGVPDSIIRDLTACGLAGLEVHHPAHRPKQRQHYLGLARHLGLVPTAGSDFHGDDEGHAPLGTERLPALGLAQLEARRIS